jgi:tocopherol O-methyltransferase
VAGDVAAERQVSDNRPARQAVIDYYDHCRDDYRILWRTDENGTIHFGYFDGVGEGRSHLRAGEILRSAYSLTVGLAAAFAAGCVALTGTAWGRDAAVRWLRVAARGRAARHDAAQRRMTAVCAEAVQLARGALVLDAGCGVGGADLWLASSFGARVHGINVQHGHLRAARRAAAAHPSGSRVGFSVQDFTEMGVSAEAVDVVWALESVCHCLDKTAFIREAYRVLRPGGRLLVADFFQSQDEVSADRAEAMRIWTSGWALPNLASGGQFRSALAAAGFRDIVYRDVRQNVLPSSRRLYKASLVAQPISAMLERTGARSSIQGRNVLAARHQYATLRDGVWTYGIFVAAK